MRASCWTVILAACALGAAGGAGHAPAAGADEAGADVEHGVARLLAIPAPHLAASLKALDTPAAGEHLAENLRSQLASPDLSVTANSGPNSTAQFSLAVEVARAGYFRDAGGWKAGVVLWATVRDVSSRNELVRERFAATTEAADNGGVAPLQGLASENLRQNPLGLAFISATEQLSAYLRRELPRYPWQCRITRVYQDTALDPLGRTANYDFVVLDCGQDAGLRAGDRLTLRRYSERIIGSEGEVLGKVPGDPLGTLRVRTVQPHSALAYLDIPIDNPVVRQDPKIRPLPGDIARMGDAVTSRAIHVPPPAIRDKSLDPKKEAESASVSTAIHQFLEDNLIQFYSPPGTEAAKRNRLESGITVVRDSKNSPIKVTVRLKGVVEGHAADLSFTREALAVRPNHTALLIWKDVEAKLNAIVGITKPAVPSTGNEGNRMAGKRPAPQAEPACVALYNGVPDRDFKTDRPDFPLEVHLDREDGRYKPGDFLSATVMSPLRDCYIQVWNVDGGLRCAQVWPPIAKRNDPLAGLLKKGQSLRLPSDPNEAFPVLNGSSGSEYLAVVAVDATSRGRSVYPLLASLVQSAYPVQDPMFSKTAKPLPPEYRDQAVIGRGLGQALRVTEKRLDEDPKISPDPESWKSLYAASVVSWYISDGNVPAKVTLNRGVSNAPAHVSRAAALLR